MTLATDSRPAGTRRRHAHQCGPCPARGHGPQLAGRPHPPPPPAPAAPSRACKALSSRPRARRGIAASAAAAAKPEDSGSKCPYGRRPGRNVVRRPTSWSRRRRARRTGPDQPGSRRSRPRRAHVGSTCCHTQACRCSTPRAGGVAPRSTNFTIHPLTRA